MSGKVPFPESFSEQKAVQVWWLSSSYKSELMSYYWYFILLIWTFPILHSVFVCNDTEVIIFERIVSRFLFSFEKHATLIFFILTISPFSSSLLILFLFESFPVIFQLGSHPALTVTWCFVLCCLTIMLSNTNPFLLRIWLDVWYIIGKGTEGVTHHGSHEVIEERASQRKRVLKVSRFPLPKTNGASTVSNRAFLRLQIVSDVTTYVKLGRSSWEIFSYRLWKDISSYSLSSFALFSQVFTTVK